MAVQALVVYRGLARALRPESADAIAAAWGVPVSTVKDWQAIGIKKPARHIGNGSTKRVWTPEEDAVILRASDFVRTAALLNTTVGAVKYRRYCLDPGQAKAADQMRKAPRKKKRQ